MSYGYGIIENERDEAREFRTTSDSASGGSEEMDSDDTDGGVFSPAFKRKCRELLRLRDEYDEADAKAKALKKDRDEAELDLYDLFEGLTSDESGQKTTITLPVDLGPPYGVVKFRARATHYAKIIDEDELLEYLNQRALTEEVSGTSFVKKRLHEMVREAKENNRDMPPGLTYYTDRGMTVTRNDK